MSAPIQGSPVVKAKPINSGALPRRSNIDSGDLYVPVSPFMIFADTMSNFALYYRQGDNIVLYLKERELLTAQLKQRLHDNGISTVYVRKSQVKEYLEHAEGNLGKVLSNEEIPLKERAKCFAGVSRSVVREVYEKSLGDTLKSHGYDRISDLVKSSVQFLSTPEGLKQFATLTDHHYSTFNHCINVFAYVTAILSHLGAAAEDITHCGIAAMLHDIGKSKVPVAILDKPGQLDDDEW
jgi:HD-GYP domain-containing protein (c-di-GMP phosphodiesterase class II)